MTMRVIVADDERLARDGLTLRLSAHEDVEVVAECRNGREALEAIQAHAPDVAFLDVEMPGLSGVEVAEQLSKRDDAPRIVFVTAYDRYAVAAFESAAVDYLLKPFDADRLSSALERIRNDLVRSRALQDRRGLLKALRRLTGRENLQLEEALEGRLEPDTLSFDDNGTTHRVALVEIDYVEAAGDYMCLRAGDQTFVLRATLNELTERLAPAGFLRIHRSVLVNTRRIRSFQPNGHGDGHVRLRDGTELRCSRTYRAAVRAALDA